MISSSTTLDVLTRDQPHQMYRFPEEEDDSDWEAIYVTPYGMNIDLAAEEMGYTDVNSGEIGDEANDMDSSYIAVPVEEVRGYQNLWSSEDDPRSLYWLLLWSVLFTVSDAKKGMICEDMAKMLRDMKRAELKANWEKENLKKDKGTRILYILLFLLLSLFPDNEPTPIDHFF